MGGHGLITYASTACHGETTPCPQVQIMDSRSLNIEMFSLPFYLRTFNNCHLQGSCLNFNLERYPCFLENIDIGGPEAGLVDWTYSASRQVSFTSLVLFILLPHIFLCREQCRDFCSRFPDTDSFVWTKPEESPENQICYCKVRNTFSLHNVAL